MKLIKLSEDHYIVVDDSKYIVDCDWVLFNNEVLQTDYFDSHFNKWEFKNKSVSPVEYQRYDKPKKITHSTQPIERWFQNIDFSIRKGFGKIQQLSLLEVKELLGEVDVDNIVDELSEKPHYTHSSQQEWFKIGAYSGYNQALEDNKNKVSLKDLKRFLAEGRYTISKDAGGNITADFTELISLLTSPETEWDVEFVDGKLKLI